MLTQMFIFDPPYLRRQKTGGIRLLGHWPAGGRNRQLADHAGQGPGGRLVWLDFIVTLAVLAVGGLTALVIRELRAEHPGIDLTVFRYRSYAIGTMLMTLIGFVLYGSTVLLPLFMQVLLGYRDPCRRYEPASRLASFLIMPIVGRLTGKVDSRKLLAIGLGASAYAMWELSRFNLNVGFWNFWWPLTIQGAALGFSLCR